MSLFKTGYRFFIQTTQWFYLVLQSKTGADPGFPVGGVDPLGGVDLRRGHFSVKMYVKTKELGPIGGGVRQKILYVDLPMKKSMYMFSTPHPSERL